jgi:SWI/SNF-related matrix-associated actin-dependent regulator 1 of chromatin subfamily A
MNLPIEKIALDILKTYNGTNDYILQVQKEYFKNKSFVPTKKQSDYVIRFQNVNPHVVKKDIGIHKSCRQFVQEQLKLDFLPESIYIDKLLSRKDDLLHIWGCFGGDCGYYQTIFISKECLKKIKPLPPLNFEKYEREPKPHQIEAIEKLLQNEKFILADDMGLGKTTSAIIAAMEGKFQKILVVCPASLKLNWKKEIMNYDSAENISIVDGVDFRVKKWTIVNYDILKNFHHLPERGVKISDLPTSPIDFHKFDLVIADEAHYLKTSTSNRTKIFNDFASRIPNRWLLTGTPITNKPVDFYNLLYLCESPIATNWMFYVRRYCAARQFNRKGTKQKYWVTSGASNLDELREYSSDCILRRTKKDSIDLPQKTIKPVYLPIELCTNYNSYIAEYEVWVEEMVEMGEKPTVTDHLVKLTKVRQLLSNDKIQHTISLAEDLIENGHKVIIFSCFTQSINAIHEHFGKTSVLIDGSVSKEKRQLAVDRFQSEDKVKVFCGNIVAAGVGLTLTEGSIVIFNDLDWTPANHAQAEDRAHRIGQVNDVHIIYPLFDETLDITMYNTLRKKMKIIGQVMGDAMFEDDDVSMGKEVIQSLTKS